MVVPARAQSGEQDELRRTDDTIDRFRAGVLACCARHLGEPVVELSQPGGPSRCSWRAHFASATVIVTRREDPRRSELEFQVLSRLAASAAPAVPRVIAFDGTWLIQEDLGDARLTDCLARGDAEQTETGLDQAIASLCRIHDTARQTGLGRDVAVLGVRPAWLEGLAREPAQLSQSLDIPAPGLDLATLAECLAPQRIDFIKWDARPGNANLRDGHVAWYDWEHCGARDPIDDLVWLLADEFVPYDPALEARLLARCLSEIAPDRSADAATEYLSVFGCFHMVKRLQRIVDAKGDGPWQDAGICVGQDKAGITSFHVTNLCHRGTDWAARHPLTRPMAPWFEALHDYSERHWLPQ